MATAIEWFQFYYPYLIDETDARHASIADIDMALIVAAAWRPACLPEDQQAQAQAHRMAYELEFRARVAAMTAAVAAGTEVVAGPVIEKQEGSVSVKYSTSGGTTNTSFASIRNALTGPGTPYAKWQELWALCGGITDLPPGTLPVRRGAITTAFG